MPWFVALLVAAALLMLTRPFTRDAGDRAANVFGDDPLQRVAACESASVAQLVALASDTDWRVRAAAYAALDRVAPIEDVPMRDTPMAEREVVLLDWLLRNEPDLLADLCEVYAHAPFAEYDDTLVAACLRCHVGPEPTPVLAAGRCASCHQGVHDQWIGTAHAQSLSHLRLRTVDHETRQPVWYDFGDRTGMSCVACHEPAGDHAQCLATFRTVSCAECHGVGEAQWRQWIAGPRPALADWPPGSMTFDTGPDAPSCVSCHMKDNQHLWASRRDPDFLRSGVDLRIRHDADGGWQLVLTNLAGHDYPTGTRRRAIEVYLQVDDQPEQLIASLQPRRLPADSDDGEPPLAPGEQRVYPVPDGAGDVACRLVFVRDRFAEDSYTCEVIRVSRSLRP